MIRRDFVKMMALLAAGASAMPEQIAAFETIYDANTPRRLGLGELWSKDFVSIEDWVIGFDMVGADRTYNMGLYDGNTAVLSFALNQRALMRYVRPPQVPVLSRLKTLRWEVEETELEKRSQWAEADPVLNMTMKVMDGSGKIHTITSKATSGWVKDFI